MSGWGRHQIIQLQTEPCAGSFAAEHVLCLWFFRAVFKRSWAGRERVRRPRRSRPSEARGHHGGEGQQAARHQVRLNINNSYKTDFWSVERFVLKLVCVCVLGAGRRTTGPIRRAAQTSTAGSYTTAGRASSTATTPTTSSPISTASSRRSEQPETHSSTLCCYKSPGSVSWDAKWKQSEWKAEARRKEGTTWRRFGVYISFLKW